MVVKLVGNVGIRNTINDSRKRGRNLRMGKERRYWFSMKQMDKMVGDFVSGRGFEVVRMLTIIKNKQRLREKEREQ